MKKRIIWRLAACISAAVMLCAGAQAAVQEFDAQIAENWLAQFAGALSQLAPLNDPQATADPARAGQYLIEYEFGTVLSRVSRNPAAVDILEIDVRSPQVSDCRGVQVGMGIEQAMGGAQLSGGSSPLQVLGTQESGYGWSWAYVGEDGVYGVEYITYGGSDAAMTEYTLTYVIDAGLVSAIRMKAAQATLAQAQEGLYTAEEIASRQGGEALALRNTQTMLTQADLQIAGSDALGVPVAELVAHIGEPEEVQTLPQGGGRILLYDGAAVRLEFNEATGEEIVRGVSVNSAAITGPRRLTVGMDVSEAASLIRCDTDVSAAGGMLYTEGEAASVAPYGELRALAGGEMTLVYACETDGGEVALLEAGIRNGAVTYWQLSYLSDAEGGV